MSNEHALELNRLEQALLSANSHAEALQRTLAKAEEERKNTHAELIESQVEEERLRNTIKELKLQLEEQAHDHRSS